MIAARGIRFAMRRGSVRGVLYAIDCFRPGPVVQLNRFLAASGMARPGGAVAAARLRLARCRPLLELHNKMAVFGH
jgi:hypothetical protein